ncbi:OmpA/MotB family protein [Roseospirillum parvum]|uniref:Chemotaxis protein MotB n=1 Tax=Roseospirillum parvum TaxID=83401 RepID=A0A1G7YEE4_9PROT|nr:flagellar motor protein MotB [Roseospirillum parvum]SDG94753.1 chemotaxis protein MotB [Roseospirillum parvum]
MFHQKDGKFTSRRRNDEGAEDWMITYGDMVTLLLAFFVLLASISKVDLVLFEQVQAGLAEGLGAEARERPIETLKKELADTIETMQVEDVVGLGEDSRGITIEFASTAFFAPGSAELNPAALPILTRVAATLMGERYVGFQIEVQGHTDDTPISTEKYPSNWELSSARASSVVRFFADQGIYTPRMSAIGLADVAPKVPNRDPFGEPLPNNQEINRRVVVRVSPALTY